jgi:hypothetical protein
VTGPVEFRGADGALLLSRVSADGMVTLSASDLAAGPEQVQAFGRTVSLEGDAGRKLLAWAACVDVEAEGEVVLEKQSRDALSRRADLLRSCREVRGDQVAEALRAVDAALEQRMPGVEAAAPTEAPSWEEAETQNPPQLTLGADEKVLSALDAPLDLVGQAVLLQGVVSARPGDRSAVLRVGSREVWLESPWEWPVAVVTGTRAEAIAVSIGARQVEARTLPAFKVVAVRPAF